MGPKTPVSAWYQRLHRALHGPCRSVGRPSGDSRVTLSQHTDGFGAREGQKCDRFAFVVAQFANGRSGVLSHGCRI